MDYEKKYNEAVCNIQKLLENGRKEGEVICAYEADLMSIFPELKESEDEKIRKGLIGYFKDFRLGTFAYLEPKKIIAWLEKQGTSAKLSEEEQNRFAKGVLSSCALSFIDYLDAHKYEGKMCVSNGECEDIENAFHNAMWDRLHRYYCKYIEKQGEKKPAKNIVETWKEMRLEVYQQASGNRHEPNYSDDTTKMFSLNDIDEIIEKISEKKPVEWSEEDKDMLRMLLEMINYASDHYQHDDKATDIKALVLKSLKDRIQSQSTWKPSDEHIHGLIWVINRMPDIKNANEAEAVLRDLLEQLNKLRKG